MPATPPLPAASFDVVASSLVLFFLPDPAAALARWVRLLAPGGRIGLTTFGDEHPVWTALNELFRPWLPPGMLDPKVVGPDAPFSSDAGMETLLRDAGATDVRTVTRRVDVPWGDVEGWKAFSMSTGQRAMWAMVPAEERDGLRGAGGRDPRGRPRRHRPGRHLAGHALHPRQRSGLTAAVRPPQSARPRSSTERTRASGVPSIHSTARAPPRPPMTSVGPDPDEVGEHAAEHRTHRPDAVVDGGERADHATAHGIRGDDGLHRVEVDVEEHDPEAADRLDPGQHRRGGEPVAAGQREQGERHREEHGAERDGAPGADPAAHGPGGQCAGHPAEARRRPGRGRSCPPTARGCGWRRPARRH